VHFSRCERRVCCLKTLVWSTEARTAQTPDHLIRSLTRHVTTAAAQHPMPTLVLYLL